MGRKRKGKGKGHQWVRDDVDGEAREPIFRVSHRAIQAEDDELERFVAELLGLPAERRGRLPVDETLIVAMDEALRLEGSAKARMLRRVKKLLRGHDVEALQATLEEPSPGEQRASVLERWRTRILSEGDPAIAAFVSEHPQSDRQAIRSLARTARGNGAGAQRAAKKLFQELKVAAPLERGAVLERDED